MKIQALRCSARGCKTVALAVDDERVTGHKYHGCWEVIREVEYERKCAVCGYSDGPDDALWRCRACQRRFHADCSGCADEDFELCDDCANRAAENRAREARAVRG